MIPPTRVGEFESPAVLEKDQKSLAVSAGADMAFFYVGAGEVSAICRLGLGDGLETGVTVSAMQLGLGKGHLDRIRSNPSPYVATANARFKKSPPELKNWLAVFGGIGAGYSEPATFLTLDAGFTVGYENRWLVPYIGADAMANLPVVTREVQLGEPDAPEDTLGERAPATVGVMPFIGLKLPLRFLAVRNGQVPALMAETHVAFIHTPLFGPVFLGVQAAIEFPVAL